MLKTSTEVGLPVVLGIKFDAVHLEMRLPREKLLDIQQMIQSWLGRPTCRKKEMESIVGKLSHASKVIQPGKTFLCQLIEVIGGARKSFHLIRLNTSTRSDIPWWATFAQAWNGDGVSLIKEYGVEHVDHCVVTDASGGCSCGGL